MKKIKKKKQKKIKKEIKNTIKGHKKISKSNKFSEDIKTIMNAHQKGIDNGKVPANTPNEIKQNRIINGIVNGVRINKALIKKDKELKKEWQETYYQHLFADFKKLVDKHNEIYEKKLEMIEEKIKEKVRMLNQLIAEVGEIEALKKVKEGIDKIKSK